MMEEPMRFDRALPALVQALQDAAGADFVQNGTALCDASGRLVFFAPDDAQGWEPERRQTLSQRVAGALGAYARSGQAVVFDPDRAARAFDPAERLPVEVVPGLYCHVVDRRIVGSGWLEAPATQLAAPPRIVFASLKGGVGRSTALAIAAADLARRGRNVLVVDLDLEAPGLGHLLLPQEDVPDYGVIDYLVENGLSGVEPRQMPRFIGTSSLTQPLGGRVDVMPALGRNALEYPGNTLAKLARAMTDDTDADGEAVSVGQQLTAMLDAAARFDRYDAVLIDSRAGLAELAAPALLGIGAQVLLFGLAQRQTIEGYRALFAALKLLAQREREQGGDANWRLALHPVYAKASLAPAAGTAFLDDMYDLYAEYLYDAEPDVATGEVSQQTAEDLLYFSRDATDAPHWPLTIAFDARFAQFDPLQAPDQLTQPFYETAFRPFLDGVDRLLSQATHDAQASVAT